MLDIDGSGRMDMREFCQASMVAASKTTAVWVQPQPGFDSTRLRRKHPHTVASAGLYKRRPRGMNSQSTVDGL